MLEAAAKKAGWQEGARSDGTRGRGVAYSRYETIKAYVALSSTSPSIARRAQVKVDRVTAAVDAGQIINTDGLTNQIEGGIIQGTSWTLKEAGEVRSRDDHHARLGELSDPHLHRSARGGRGPARPSGAALARRGRSVTRTDARRDRQCDLPRDRRAAARPPVHAGARESRDRSGVDLSVYGSITALFRFEPVPRSFVIYERRTGSRA